MSWSHTEPAAPGVDFLVVTASRYRLRPALSSTSWTATANATPRAPRRMVRRRFPDRPIAPAKHARAMSGMNQAIFWRKLTNPWTCSRSFDCTITSCCLSGGTWTLSRTVMPFASNLCLTFSTICSTLTATVPFSVDTRLPPPVSTLTSAACARRFTRSQSVSNRLDCARRSAARSTALRTPSSRGAARKEARGGNAAAIFFSTLASLTRASVTRLATACWTWGSEASGPTVET